MALGVLVVLGWTSWSIGWSGNMSLKLAQSPWLEGRLEEDLTWKQDKDHKEP